MNYIKVWNIGDMMGTYVFPHMQLGCGAMTYAQMETTVNQLIEKMDVKKGEIVIETEYCSELDGKWNITLAFKGMDYDIQKNRTFMYLIRRDLNHNDTFTGPFYHFGRDEVPLSPKHHRILYKNVEKILYEIFPNAFEINAFQTKFGIAPAKVARKE